jgi:hypothetical protein
MLQVSVTSGSHGRTDYPSCHSGCDASYGSTYSDTKVDIRGGVVDLRRRSDAEGTDDAIPSEEAGSRQSNCSSK